MKGEYSEVDAYQELFGSLPSPGLTQRLKGDFTGSIWAYAEELLAEGGVPPPENYQPWTLPQLADRTTQIKELAIAGSRYGDVQRVRVARLEPTTTPASTVEAFHIDARFPVGKAGALIMKLSGQELYTFNTDERGPVSRVYGKNAKTAETFGRFMWLAAERGVSVPAEDHGKRTTRERLQGIGAFLGSVPLDSAGRLLDSVESLT